MTWGEANYIHQHQGHDEFLRQARLHDKWPIFIQNVCKNQACPDVIDIPDSEENNAG